MGTRKRTAQGKDKSQSQSTSSQINQTASNLPPSRRSKTLQSVSPPLSSLSFNKFIYLLLLLTALMSTWYGYRVVQHKREVGGWWNLVTGKGPVPGVQTAEGMGGVWNKGGRKPRKGKAAAQGAETVEDKINALALALGLPSPDLARAIAGAVRQYVPPASLKSIAADPRETGKAVEALLNKEVVVDDGTGVPVSAGGGSVAGTDAPGAQATGSGGILEGVASGVESFVGMDEP